MSQPAIARRGGGVGRGGAGALVLAAAAAGLAAAPACGDGPICPLEVYVAITSPAAFAEIGPGDDRTDDPTLEVEVKARTNLGEGETLELEVRDRDDAVSTYTATVDDAGKVTFRDVAIPAGEVSLRARASYANCGVGTDEVEVRGVTEARCDLRITPEPVPNEYYDPLPVLTAYEDGDPSQPDFQANFEIETHPDYDVELTVLDLASANEHVVDGGVTGERGTAQLRATLGQGAQAVRAACSSREGATTAASDTHTVFVDSHPPTCEIAAPADGDSIIPELDEDPDRSGTQVTLVGVAGGDDVDPDSATFAVGAQTLEGTPVKDGETTAVATFDAPGDVDIELSVSDYAGNTCVATRRVTYATDGCAIAHEAPTEVVTEDAEPLAEGLQTELAVSVDPACEGREVVTTCDVFGELSAPAATGAPTTMQITACEEAYCVRSYDCETRVVSEGGITTRAPATIHVDTAPPSVALQFVDPSDLECGDVVDDGVDVDPESGEVMIDARVVSPDAEKRLIQVTAEHSDFIGQADDDGELRIPLMAGKNDIVAIAEDAHGNRGVSDVCPIELGDQAGF